MSESGFSIIVCTFNPDPRLFERLIVALSAIISKSTVPLEIIFVDNKSTIPITEDRLLLRELSCKANYHVVREEQPGLTYARIAGYRKAIYEWLIFVDDDNLPADNYINELSRLVKIAPEVKCWGAGKIDVEYIDKKETAFLQSVKKLFQQRDFPGVQYSCNRMGEVFYPPGSSMCVHKTLFKKYNELIQQGGITSSDRTGYSLNSAGDVQIIYTCLKEGFSVGSSGNLYVRHLITRRKTKFSYIIKLVYSLNSCQIKAYNEVFTDMPIPVSIPGNIKIIQSVFTFVRQKKITPIKNQLIELSKLFGMHNAQYLAKNCSKPLILVLFERIIGHR